MIPLLLYIIAETSLHHSWNYIVFQLHRQVIFHHNLPLSCPMERCKLRLPLGQSWNHKPFLQHTATETKIALNLIFPLFLLWIQTDHNIAPIAVSEDLPPFLFCKHPFLLSPSSWSFPGSVLPVLTPASCCPSEFFWALFSFFPFFHPLLILFYFAPLVKLLTALEPGRGSTFDER